MYLLRGFLIFALLIVSMRLMCNGCLLNSAATKVELTRITKERISSQLRRLGILHLGMVNRLYIEANGMFTLVKEKELRPGLSVA